jgi:ABC-type multidrug transport system fused ATPase/permease subunit
MQNPQGMFRIDQLSLKDKFSNALFFLGYLKPVWWIAVSVIVINLVSASSLIPIMDFGRILTDYFSNKGSVIWSIIDLFASPSNALYMYVVLAGFLIILSGAVTLVSNYYSSWVREFLMRRLRLDVYKSLEHLNMQSVNMRGAGDYVQGIHRDVYSVDQLFNELFSRTLPQAIFAGVAFVVLLNINWIMTLALFVAGFVLFPIFGVCNKKVNSLSEFLRYAFTEISDQLIETIGGFRDIIASGNFDRFAKRFDDTLQRSQSSAVSISWWSQVGGITTVSMMSLFGAVPIIVVIPQLLAASADGQPAKVASLIGATISYVLFLQHFLQIYSTIYQFFQTVALTSPSFFHLRGMVSGGPPPMPMPMPMPGQGGPPMGGGPGGPMPPQGGPQAGGPPGGMPFPVQGGPPNVPDLPQPSPATLSPVQSIRFENVSMHFNGPPVFQGLGFTIPGGKISAIVGQSGSGKTTIFNLLLKLLDPTAGKILINDHSLRWIDEKLLKRSMGLIPQDPFIFNCSIRENLLMGAGETADEKLINRAVNLAQLSEFIESRPEGLEFVAGHMGRNLSAGEKQRLALARLILQDPEIIICDEYTANIDVKIAGLIHDVMRTEFSGRTRIIISHQLYTIKGADHIIVLDKGEIAQAGTHEDLIAKPGVYRDLWELQRLA